MHENIPTILVCNDDGIHAQGIRTLATAMAPLGKVVVVAPMTDQSAVSHAMSLRRPLRMHHLPPLETKHGMIEMYGIDGTPTDAVYMAAHHILQKQKPSLVVSGINHGANLGDDVFYSGTVSAAMEGVFLGIPALAFSLVANHSFDFSSCAPFATEIATAIIKQPLPKGCLLNVNFPKKISQKEFAVTKLGHHEYLADVQERKDPRGNSYYWIGGEWSRFTDLPGTDCKAISEGHISVSPIELSLTAHKLLPWVSSLNVNNFSVRREYEAGS